MTYGEWKNFTSTRVTTLPTDDNDDDVLLPEDEKGEDDTIIIDNDNDDDNTHDNDTNNNNDIDNDNDDNNNDNDDSHDNSLKIYHAMKKLEGFFNPEATQYVQNFEQGRETQSNNTYIAIYNHVYDNTTKYREIFNVPINYNDAWNNNCKWQQQRWREAINKERNKMTQNKVWKNEKKSNMEKGRKSIKCKWVFDI
jgi:hypothetical protein